MILNNQLYKIESREQADAATVYHIRLLPECPIYKAHFPGQPVTPGACLVQMTHELLEDAVGHALTVMQVKDAKFLNILSPEQSPAVNFTLTLDKKADGILTTKANITAGDETFAVITLICDASH